MRPLIRTCGLALIVVTAVAESSRSDDAGYGSFVVSPVTSEQSAATAAPSAAGQPCPVALDQPAQPAMLPSPFDGDLCTRPYLLGNLCGVRDQLAAHGVTVNV